MLQGDRDYILGGNTHSAAVCRIHLLRDLRERRIAGARLTGDEVCNAGLSRAVSDRQLSEEILADAVEAGRR
ncbi:hypothetical protein ABIB85_004421 [Bradyrhizobium sp. JR1.5]|uniref:hypothetical protein n=1 Tax=unclassified Bradyrhizobium TaxID=2631580 RepID=UPI003395647F